MKKISYFFSYLFFSFIIFGMWEWLQTPFYVDKSIKINEIIYFRIHCTIGDILILSGAILVFSLWKRNVKWIFDPNLKDYTSITLLGLIYTIGSEIINVKINKSWSYSEIMPIIPKIEIGIIPIIQWIILPTVIMYVVKRFVNEGKRNF